MPNALEAARCLHAMVTVASRAQTAGTAALPHQQDALHATLLWLAHHAQDAIRRQRASHMYSALASLSLVCLEKLGSLPELARCARMLRKLVRHH